MGKAGRALKQVLEEYDISQYGLSVADGCKAQQVYRWVNKKRDPTAATVIEIIRTLIYLNIKAEKPLLHAIRAMNSKAFSKFSKINWKQLTYAINRVKLQKISFENAIDSSTLQ